MKSKKSYHVIAIVISMLFAGATGSMAQQVYTYNAGSNFGEIKVGNAGDECARLGDLLSSQLGYTVEFVYAYKFNEDGNTEVDENGEPTEGAPNGNETYTSDDGTHSNAITISGSNGETFNWSATNSIGAVMVKAGQGYDVYYYDPQAFSDTGLAGFEDRAVSHVTFCWNPDITAAQEWCSPGYWRQDHHLDSWPPTGYNTVDLYEGEITLSKKGQRADATTNPTLLEVLESPQYYGGDAFNAVGDLLSDAHPDVNFNGERIEDSCPLN